MEEEIVYNLGPEVEIRLCAYANPKNKIWLNISTGVCELSPEITRETEHALRCLADAIHEAYRRQDVYLPCRTQAVRHE